MGKTKHIDYDDFDDVEYYNKYETEQKHLKLAAKLDREIRHKREIHEEAIITPQYKAGNDCKGRTR